MKARRILTGWVLNVMLAGSGMAADSLPRYRIDYATYLGGPEWDQAREIIVCPDGSLLMGGQSNSSSLPTTPGVVQGKYAGDDPSLGHPGMYGGDCYLIRLSGDGTKVLACTYLGGSKQERNVYGMAVDSKGNVVITSATRSPDAPTTEGCFQRKYGGGLADMLVAKLSPDFRKLIWCTYVGGSDVDFPRGGLTLDPSDNVYILGTTSSKDFPTTPGVLGPKLIGPKDSTIVKLKSDGSGLIFSTCLGGSGEDDTIMGARLDAQGNIYVGGITKSVDFPVTDGAPQSKLGGQSDCYMAKLSKDASHLIYSTYLGGTGNEFAEHRAWLTPDNCLLLTGFSGSSDFPTTPDAYQRTLNGKGDGFLTKISADGKRWVFSMLLGGSGSENLLMPTVDGKGNIYVVGSTSSKDLPVTADALQPTYGGGTGDAMLAVFSPDGSKLLYCSYLGGSGDDLIRSITFGRNGEVYLVGSTSSEDFFVTPTALQRTYGGKMDAFLVKLVPKT